MNDEVLARRRRQSSDAPLPRWNKPQLSRLVKEAPAGSDWLHEIKFDGYRLRRAAGAPCTVVRAIAITAGAAYQCGFARIRGVGGSLRNRSGRSRSRRGVTETDR